MGKNRHHFVPRLYLKYFQSDPKRIHLYNLKISRGIKNVSLRDQCYKHKLYGLTDHIEDNLSDLEAQIGPVLQSVTVNKILPRKGTEEYIILFILVALQLLRTPRIASRMNTLIDKTIKQVSSHDPRLASVDLDSLRIGFQDPVIESLRFLPQILQNIEDLRCHLVISAANGFVTSDNPVFKYNQYCEGIQYMGITGAVSRGLQIFLPLAPHAQLVIYDSSVYKVKGAIRSHVSIASPPDVERMNAMQLVSADQNVYFSDWRHLEHIRRLTSDVDGLRYDDPTEVVEYGHDNDQSQSLIHAFEHTPCLNLSLSFLKLKKSANQTPLHDRAGDFRKQATTPESSNKQNLEGHTVSFSRFIGRR